MRQKASLAEQDSSLGSKTENKAIWPVEVRSGNMDSTELLLVTVERKFMLPKLSCGLRRQKGGGQ